jgi:hypothetical protein
VELWPWVRDHTDDDPRVLADYAVALDDVQRSYVELRMFCLHYVRHARDHRPDVDRALRDNPARRAALIDVDDAYTRLVATAAALEPTVFAHARARGVDLARRDDALTNGGAPQRGDELAALRAIRGYLESAAYRDVRAGRREHVEAEMDNGSSRGRSR